MARRSFILLPVLFLSLLLCSCSAPDLAKDWSEGFSPKHYICYRAGEPLVIDGKMDDPPWQAAEWTDDFQDIEGSKKPIPPLRTRAKMLWDDDYFYVAAELEEPHVWANLTERDSVIFHDNDFEIFIDPDGDTHYYYELEMNALNTVWDLFLDKPYRDGCKPLFFWDIRGLRTGVSVDGTLNRSDDRDQGWTVELALPWAVLKECAPGGSPPGPGDQWRVNFSRVEWRVEIKDGKYIKVKDPKTFKPLPEDNWVWSPQGVINMHCPETWGFVQFSGKAAGSGRDFFQPRKEENAKRALRRLYHEEARFHDKLGRYTNYVSELGLQGLVVEGYRWPPKIKYTWNWYEASLQSWDGKETWHIRKDGLVWK